MLMAMNVMMLWHHGKHSVKLICLKLSHYACNGDKSLNQHELETTHIILTPEFVYRFADGNGTAYAEFHVDYCSKFNNEDNLLLQGRKIA
jgi:hypothetical protein